MSPLLHFVYISLKLCWLEISLYIQNGTLLILCHLKGELVSTPLDKDGTHNGQEKAPNFLGRPFFYIFLTKCFFFSFKAWTTRADVNQWVQIRQSLVQKVIQTQWLNMVKENQVRIVFSSPFFFVLCFLLSFLLFLFFLFLIRTRYERRRFIYRTVWPKRKTRSK